MAYPAASVFEVRTTGAATNGGGYVTGGAGTDYSQQDAAQLALTDIASDGAGTAISSATGGFTAQMVDNFIYITGGTGFTEGWYHIVTYVDTNNITIERSAGASKTGGTGNVGGAWKFHDDYNETFLEAFTAGNKVWIKAGTYAFDISIDITNDVAMTFSGYNSTRDDKPIGTNRPLIESTTVNVAFNYSAGYWKKFEHLRFKGNHTSAFFPSYNARLFNCYIENISVGANDYALSSTATIAVGCEFVANASSAYAVYANSSSRFLSCYIHGPGGISTPSGGIVVINSVFKVTGFVFSTGVYDHNVLVGNTSSGASKFFNGTSSVNNLIANNIIDDGTDGIDIDDVANLIFNNVMNVSGTAYLSNASDDGGGVSGDPNLANPAGEDFSIDTVSNAYGTAMSVGTYTGATI